MISRWLCSADPPPLLIPVFLQELHLFPPLVPPSWLWRKSITNTSTADGFSLAYSILNPLLNWGRSIENMFLYSKDTVSRGEKERKTGKSGAVFFGLKALLKGPVFLIFVCGPDFLSAVERKSGHI